MIHRREGDLILARVDVGEEIIACLRDLVHAEKLPWAAMTGLGAVGEVTLAYWDPATKSYTETRFAEDLEMVSMTGNLAWLGEVPVVHAHGVFSRRDCTTVGGHIMHGVVSVTVEVMLTVGQKRVERRPDERVGLNLLAP